MTAFFRGAKGKIRSGRLFAMGGSLLLAALLLWPGAARAQSAARAKAASSRVVAFRGNCSSIFGDGDSGGGQALPVPGQALPASRQAGMAAKDKPAESATAARGFDLANLDRSVEPCQNFWQFANGGWRKSHPIPSDHAAWGLFNVLQQHNQQVLHQILEEAARDKHPQPDSNWQKIGNYYASCMNTAAIDAAGTTPLEPEFQRIDAISNARELQAEIARLQTMGVNVGFQFGSEQDLKNSSEVIAGAAQGGLGLPDRQYYLDQDAKSKQLRGEYTAHVARMFTLLGDSAAKANAESATVLSLETKLAEASTKVADLRVPEQNYHPMTLRQMDGVTPHFSWQAYFDAVGRPHLQGADIGQPNFFKALDTAIASVPVSDWKVYLRWHLLHAAAPALPERFAQENFNFYGHTLQGTPQMLPRWQRCVASTDRELGEALGQYYVKRAFPPEAKAAALAMVKNIMGALRQDLSTLSWMSPDTRQAAIAKLDMIMLKIGYPDKWRDYSNYNVTAGPYVENLLRGNDFEFHWDLSKIGKPLDRTLWDMTPPTVNAYYNPSMNEIVFPAGILQPPFFDPHADAAVNYGGIGAVIGHEMTHGFDDQGAKFDGHGNLKNWWTPQDLKNFQARGECIVQQLDAFEAFGLHEPGKLDEGEAIADLGGMAISYRAFQNTPEAKAGKKIDGFTPDQRFFLGFARNWASNLRPQIAQLYMKTDPHPMDEFRANGPLSNTPAFAKAFGCSEKSPMVRPAGQRCQIW